MNSVSIQNPYIPNNPSSTRNYYQLRISESNFMVTQYGWQPAETKYTTPNPDTRSLETCPVAVILISDQLHNSNPSKLQELGRIAYIDNHTLAKEYEHILSQQSYMFNFNSCGKHHKRLDKFNQKNPLWQSGSRISIRSMCNVTILNVWTQRKRN